MKKLALLLALSLAASVAARAEAPSAPSAESIDKLLSLSHADRMRDLMISGMERGIDHAVQSVLQGKSPTAADKAVIEDMHRQIRAAVKSSLSWQDLKPVFENAYARDFTQAQIDDLIAFYSSPTGQVFADKEQQIGQQVGAVTQEKLMAIGTKLRGILQDSMEKLQEANAEPAAGGADDEKASGDEAAAAPSPAPASAAAVSAAAADTHAKGRLPLHISHGKRIMLSDYLVPGKTTVFDFYSEYCPPCRALSPLLEKLHLQRDDVSVVKVDINRPGIVGIDWHSPVAEQFHLDSITHLEVYSPKGGLVAQGDDAYKLVSGWLDSLN